MPHVSHSGNTGENRPLHYYSSCSHSGACSWESCPALAGVLQAWDVIGNACWGAAAHDYYALLPPPPTHVVPQLSLS